MQVHSGRNDDAAQAHAAPPGHYRLHQHLSMHDFVARGIGCSRARVVPGWTLSRVGGLSVISHRRHCVAARACTIPAYTLTGARTDILAASTHTWCNIDDHCILAAAVQHTNQAGWRCAAATTALISSSDCTNRGRGGMPLLRNARSSGRSCCTQG